MKIKLSRSTYRVMGFTNFAPYLASLSNFYVYLTQFKTDLSDPEMLGPPRTWGVEKAMTDTQEMIQANPSTYNNVFSSLSCKGHLYECRLLIQYEKCSTRML